MECRSRGACPWWSAEAKPLPAGGKPKPSTNVSEPRVKSGLFVSAALRLGDAAGQPGVVVRRGDADAGGILVILRGRDTLSVLAQVRTGAGKPAWMRIAGVTDDQGADTYIHRQVSRDPDLWVLEFESPGLAPPFPAELL